jgi:hypothetical protein
MQQDFIKLSLTALFACLLLSVMAMSSNASEDALSEEDNVIERIKHTAAGVEVHLRSSRAFPVRALPPVLQIGSASFKKSFNPKDGDLHRLIFLIPHNAYTRLDADLPVRVVFGQGVSHRERWEFGTFKQR